MARNGSGTMSAPAGQPAVAGTTITAAAHNDLVNDIVAEITDSLSRSGKGGMLAVLKAVDGVLGGPGYSFNSEATSGLFRAGAGDLRLAILGALVAKFTAAGLDVTGDVSVSGACAVTGAITTGGVAVANVGEVVTLTAGTGWTLQSQSCVKVGKNVSLWFWASASVGPAVWTSIAVLPVGCRPPVDLLYVPGRLNDVTAGGMAGLLSINANGVIEATSFLDPSTAMYTNVFAIGNGDAAFMSASFYVP